jgi:hypothetical protein
VETLFTMSVTAGVDEAETGPLWGRASRSTHSQETGDGTAGVGRRPRGKTGADRVCSAINPAKIVAGYDPRSVDVQELINIVRILQTCGHGFVNEQEMAIPND